MGILENIAWVLSKKNIAFGSYLTSTLPNMPVDMRVAFLDMLLCSKVISVCPLSNTEKTVLPCLKKIRLSLLIKEPGATFTGYSAGRASNVMDSSSLGLCDILYCGQNFLMYRRSTSSSIDSWTNMMNTLLKGRRCLWVVILVMLFFDWPTYTILLS